MMKSPTALMALVALSIYLFATAPPPLPDEEPVGQGSVHVNDLFRILASENEAVRSTFTAHVVGPGLKRGLGFDEDWRREEVEAGPLPAVYLRNSSERLARSDSKVGLFLGSDKPISDANRFSDAQFAIFEEVRESREPRFFVDPVTGMNTAMFPDVATAQPCVTCHNEHPESPKTDWALGDVMGATTWTYPDEQLTLDQALTTVGDLRGALQATWDEYLEDAALFAEPPPIGEGWPQDGYQLPSSEVFSSRCRESSSAATLEILLASAGGPTR